MMDKTISQAANDGKWFSKSFPFWLNWKRLLSILLFPMTQIPV